MPQLFFLLEILEMWLSTIQERKRQRRGDSFRLMRRTDPQRQSRRVAVLGALDEVMVAKHAAIPAVASVDLIRRFRVLTPG